MRTSLIEIEKIENFLLCKGKPEERLLTEAKACIDEGFKEQVMLQSKSYELIKLYGRKKLMQEIEVVENEVFKSSHYRSFQERIRSIFKF